MLSFDLTDEQRLLEQAVREWGAREIERLFAPLRVTGQFLLTTHMRELLFRKAAAGR